MPKNPFLHDIAKGSIYAPLNYCSSLDSQDLLEIDSGNTPLLWAIANSNVTVALELLDNPNTTQVNFKRTSYPKNSPLILSISKGWTHVDTLAISLYCHKKQLHLSYKRKAQ